MNTERFPDAPTFDAATIYRAMDYRDEFEARYPGSGHAETFAMLRTYIDGVPGLMMTEPMRASTEDERRYPELERAFKDAQAAACIDIAIKCGAIFGSPITDRKDMTNGE